MILEHTSPPPLPSRPSTPLLSPLLFPHPLPPFSTPGLYHACKSTAMVEVLSQQGPLVSTINGRPFHAFPSLHRLSSLSELYLRERGFGYRAAFIVQTACQLHQMQATSGTSASEWLQAMRKQAWQEVERQLCVLPGVGPKVAACVALLSLDQHAAVPVDTHVWQVRCAVWSDAVLGGEVQHAAVPVDTYVGVGSLHSTQPPTLPRLLSPPSSWLRGTTRAASMADTDCTRAGAADAGTGAGLAQRHYASSINGKTLTARVRVQLTQALEQVFGPMCGWAVNAMFASELPAVKARFAAARPATSSTPLKEEKTVVSDYTTA
ncbi:unnamed protein product [Closterium sp. NIES-53]